jgi:hypothetical protein
MGIKTGRGRGKFRTSSSSSGLTRGSLSGRTVLTLHNDRVSTDARVKPHTR